MNKPFVVSLLAFLTAMSGVTYYSLKNQTAHMRGTNVAGTDEVYQAWTQWLSSYGKQYQHDELPLRYATFSDNYNFVKNFNAQKKQFQVGLNQFADLSNQEFAALQQGQLTPKKTYSPKSLKSLGVPQSVDWRTKGGVTPVKNQGQCGSCYTFSSTGALEGLHYVKTGKLISFSEQQLVDCSQSYGNNGCNGGLMDNCFQYVQDKGIELESTYPYTGKDSGSCNYDQSQTKFSNTGFQDVVANSTDQLMAALALQPVSVAIEADQNSFQFYSGGVYNDASCGTNLDHGVLAVGYGVENGQAYYIIKNSWGPTWGDKGFIRIAATDGPSICGVQMQPSYPTA